MARIRMVTRTITETIADALCVSISNKVLFNRSIKVSGAYDNPEELLKAVKACSETDEFKVVAVSSWVKQETLYGMTEERFMAIAEILPPRKNYDTDTETENG